MVQQIELNPGDTLCKQGEASSEIYILQDGALDVFVRDKRGRDKTISEISGKFAIFGEFGAILKKPRTATIRATRHAVIQKIDTKNKALEETILGQPKLGFSISISLARYLKDTNVRLSQYAQFLNDLRKFADERLLYYYQKSKLIADLAEQKHLAWAKTIFDKVKTHICYAMGELAGKGQDPVPDDSSHAPLVVPPPEIPEGLAEGKEFKAGETIGREGEMGREIFILQSGALEIHVGGRKVSEVKEKGAVIGEVAVLAGYSTGKFETRSATILAREPSTVTVIDAAKLESLFTANPNLILFITKVLSGRLSGTNQALLADDEKIGRYLALLDPAAVTTNTLFHAYELLRTNLQSNAKDKAETQGYLEEVQTKLAEMKDRAGEFHDRYDELVKKWKPI